MLAEAAMFHDFCGFEADFGTSGSGFHYTPLRTIITKIFLIFSWALNNS